MKELKIYCSHCGKLIAKTSNTEFKIERGSSWETANLCDECYEELTHIVQQFRIGKDERK